MPVGGVHGGGSIHCSFAFVAANEKAVQYLMEDLPIMQNNRYNVSLPAPHWEPSPSINTYSAFGLKLRDSFFRMQVKQGGGAPQPMAEEDELRRILCAKGAIGKRPGRPRREGCAGVLLGPPGLSAFWGFPHGPYQLPHTLVALPYTSYFGLS